jgi:chorismate dehydratase
MRKMCRIGLISYLNSCPLGHGLADQGSVRVLRAPPSALADMLAAGALDVSLVPVVDYLAREDRWEVAAPYGICSRGAVWTVKIFSPVPMDRIDRLVVDTDSRTARNLARVLVHRARGAVPKLVRRDFAGGPPAKIEAPTLLIGDKAWRMKEGAYIYDLGEIWTREFGRPFVYAVWAAPKGRCPDEVKTLLGATARANLKRPEELGRRYGPEHGFTADQATEYFRRIIHYPIGPEEWAGLAKFKECLAALAGEPACQG